VTLAAVRVGPGRWGRARPPGGMQTSSDAARIATGAGIRWS
jgi:hypothetical protein